MTPLLRALKKLLPATSLDVLVIPETAVILKHNPHVAGILTFNKRKFRNKIFSFIQLVFQLRKRRYELAISIQSSWTSAALMLLGGVPNRLGFSRQQLLTMSVPHTRGLHKIQKILRLLEPLTDETFSMQTELYWSAAEAARASQLIDQHRGNCRWLVGIAPGSIWYTKRWLKEHFAELVRRLEQQPIQIFLIGGSEDQALCEFIQADSSAVNVAGKLSVLESAALIERLDLMITNDSAPLHIANAVQTDVIAIFGPTVKDFGFYPFRDNDQVIEVELDCRPCSWHGGKKCPLGHHNCMRWITPDRVFNEVMTHLQNRKYERY